MRIKPLLIELKAASETNTTKICAMIILSVGTFFLSESTRAKPHPMATTYTIQLDPAMAEALDIEHTATLIRPPGDLFRATLRHGYTLTTDGHLMCLADAHDQIIIYAEYPNQIGQKDTTENHMLSGVDFTCGTWWTTQGEK